MKRICSENDELISNLSQLKSTLISRGYNEDHINDQFDKVNTIDRETTLRYKEKSHKLMKTPFITTFNKQNPNIKQIIDKNWNLLKLDKQTAKAFIDKPIIAYRRNKNLRDILGQTTISNNKVKKPQGRPIGYCHPCKPNLKNLCCKQLNNTNKITSSKTKTSYTIRHNSTCKSSHLIYVMHCTKCNIQYVGKSEPTFEIRLNNHRTDAYNPNANKTIIPACKHFHADDHDFNRDAKFTIVETIQDKNLPNKEKRSLLLKRENFWILLLKTLKPDGLNISLNNN